MKNFGKIISDKDVITKEYLDSKGYISAITSKMVTDALGFTPFDSAAFTKASIKNALGIADWALAANKPSYDDVYLKLTGGTITGNLTVNGKVSASGLSISTSTASLTFTDNIIYSNASLRIYGGWSLRLGANAVGIQEWTDLKTILGLGSLAYKNSIEASDISSIAWDKITGKPTTLEGYGITDAVKIINASTYPLPTDNSAFTTYAYYRDGWAAEGAALAFPNGNYKGLIQMTYGPNNAYMRMYINGVRPEVEGNVLPWTEVLTAANIGTMAMTVSSTILDSSTDADDEEIPGSYLLVGIANVPAADGVMLITAGKNRDFVGQTIIDYNGHLYSRIRNGGTWRDWRTIVDDNNISSYTYTKTSIDSTFLKLAGGTMAANARITNPADNGTAIYFGASNMFGSLSLPTKLRGSSDPIVATASGEYTILHSGNIGTTSLPSLNLNGETITSWDDVGAIQTVYQTATSGTVSIAPNVLNKWSSALTGTLTIQFAAETSGVANYYMIEFPMGTTVRTVNLPSGLTWMGGDNILSRLEVNKTYQISVLNNLAVGGAF